VDAGRRQRFHPRFLERGLTAVAMEHPYGWWSLMPPVVAIALAIVTRHAAASLLAGLFCGALLTERGNVFLAVYDLLEVHLWPTLADHGKLRVFSFTLLMGALIGVLSRSGSMLGFVQLISPLARTRRGGQLTTWGLGLAIFFDDYANTMLLGGTLRPLCDRLRISREKLAYLVDSTAAPVAGISILSTWVAVELEYLQEGIDAIGAASGLSAFDLFVTTIPYRFYVLGALALVPIIALTGRDFGPMLAAERRAARDRIGVEGIAESGGPPAAAREESSEFENRAPAGDEATPAMAHWGTAVLSILVTLGVVVALLYATGREALVSAGKPNPSLRAILGAAQSSLSLQYGALAGLLLASVLCIAQRLLSVPATLRAAERGARVVLPAIFILWTASALSRMTSSKSVEGERSVNAAGVETFEHQRHRLYTAEFLTDLLQSGGPEAGKSARSETTLRLLPTIVFLLAAAMSFCTGTSYGTMGILTPLAVSLTSALIVAQGATLSPSDPLLLATVGSVLAGAVFGDHCSPISDTTILSAQSCQCDLVAHTVTQLPYALVVAGVAVALGTLPAGFGFSLPVVLALQLVALVLIVLWFGRTVDNPSEETR
jgi:Na+/H+ antiporter NhaC